MGGGLVRLPFSVSGGSFPKLVRDSDDRTLVRLPGLVAWWSATKGEQSVNSDGTMSWTSRKGGWILRTPSTSLPTHTTNINSRDTLQFTGAEQFDAADLTINPTSWSICVSHKLTAALSGLKTIYGPKSAAVGTYCASMGFNTGIPRMVSSAGASVLIGTGDHGGVAAINLSTKSAALGMRIYHDAVSIAANAALTQALDDTSFGVGNFGSGGTGLYVGAISDVMVFEEDYAGAKFDAARTSLFDILMDRAGL